MEVSFLGHVHVHLSRKSDRTPDFFPLVSVFYIFFTFLSLISVFLFDALKLYLTLCDKLIFSALLSRSHFQFDDQECGNNRSRGIVKFFSLSLSPHLFRKITSTQILSSVSSTDQLLEFKLSVKV